MLKDKLLYFFKKYIMIFVMNVFIFLVLFFLVPLIMDKVSSYLWRVIFAFSIAIITDLFYLTKRIEYEQVLISLPILFLLTLIILAYCTRLDLYGITSHGSIDKTPAFVDALLVDMVIVFIQYVTLFLTRFIKKISLKKLDKNK